MRCWIWVRDSGRGTAPWVRSGRGSPPGAHGVPLRTCASLRAARAGVSWRGPRGETHCALPVALLVGCADDHDCHRSVQTLAASQRRLRASLVPRSPGPRQRAAARARNRPGRRPPAAVEAARFTGARPGSATTWSRSPLGQARKSSPACARLAWRDLRLHVVVNGRSWPGRRSAATRRPRGRPWCVALAVRGAHAAAARGPACALSVKDSPCTFTG